MTLKEIVNLNCGHGKHVILTDGKLFKIVSPFKDATFNYIVSECAYDIKNCVSMIGKDRYEDFDYLEGFGWKFYSVWTPPKPKLFEINQLVDILENSKESIDYDFWPMYAKDMVGKKGLRVTLVTNDYKGVNYSVWDENETSWWNFPHECLAPHIPQEKQEQTTDVLVKDGKKYKVQIIEEIK